METANHTASTLIARRCRTAIQASTPKSTTALETCPDGKMLPPSNTARAWSVLSGPMRPVATLTIPTLTLSRTSATSSRRTGRAERRRQACQTIHGNAARVDGAR